MKLKFTLISLALLLTTQSVFALENGLISVKSKFNVAHTADRFIGIAVKNGMTVAKHIKHSEQAKKAGIDILPSELVIFGNPKIGAPMIKCAPTIAIDLPQKLLIWQDENTQTWVTYNNPIYIADRHELAADCRDGLQKIANALQKFTGIAAGDFE